jgi:hypothetical protein
VAKRDPHDVLGIDRGADRTTIKAAWRRLARAHHPDLTGDDPAASRVATRQMAEINDAYAALTRDGAESSSGTTGGQGDAPFPTGSKAPRGGPPKPRPSRPVTRRVDTTDTFRPRNETTTAARRNPLPGQPPLRGDRIRAEPLRASTPTGPLERGRVHRFRPPTRPSLDEALARVVDFGKFHGHSLGEIAAFEPSYVDWLAQTVLRDPDLLIAARVVKEDLDRRNVLRRARPAPVRPGRTA